METYKYKSITTDDFKSFFELEFAKVPAIKNINWKVWLYTPGMPPDIPKYDTTLNEVCQKFTERFIKWEANAPIPFTDEDIKSLKPQQMIQLLQNILEEKSQDVAKLKKFDEKYNLSNVKNAEIKFKWLRICLKARWEEKIDDVLKWVAQIGRMKYVRPLYRDAYSWEAARPRAIEVYRANKKNMIHVVAYVLAKDLKLTEE